MVQVRLTGLGTISWVGLTRWFEWQIWIQPELGPSMNYVRHVISKQVGLGAVVLPVNPGCLWAEQGQAEECHLLIRPNVQPQKPNFKMYMSFRIKYAGLGPDVKHTFT